MIGDKSDNILAIKPRLGEKTAEKLYPEIDAILATNPEIRCRYNFNQHLIDFDFIEENIIDAIKEKMELPFLNYHAMNLMKCFQQLNLVQMTDKIQKFKLSDQQISAKIINNKEIKQKKEEHDEEVLSRFFS